VQPHRHVRPGLAALFGEREQAGALLPRDAHLAAPDQPHGGGPVHAAVERVRVGRDRAVALEQVGDRLAAQCARPRQRVEDLALGLSAGGPRRGQRLERPRLRLRDALDTGDRPQRRLERQHARAQRRVAAALRERELEVALHVVDVADVAGVR
jgi:hypothetical protein